MFGRVGSAKRIARLGVTEFPESLSRLPVDRRVFLTLAGRRAPSPGSQQTTNPESLSKFPVFSFHLIHLGERICCKGFCLKNTKDGGGSYAHRRLVAGRLGE